MTNLNINNPFFRFMGKLGDLILLNLVWLLCCIPVVTVGASNTALFYVARKLAAGEEYRIFHDFFQALRQNWKQATATWLILAPLGGLFLVDLIIGLYTGGAFGNVFRGIGAVLCVVWLMVEGYSFLLLARYEYTVKQLLVHALFLSISNPTVTITSVALAVWLPLLMWKSLDIALYALPFWLLLGRAVSAVIVSALMLPVFRRLEAKKDGEL